MSSAPTIPFETTLHVRDACLCLHTQRAARTLARRFDEALRPAGLTNEQFSFLMALNRPEPPSQGEVAALPFWTEAHAALEAELAASAPARLQRDLATLSSPRRGAPALCDGQETAP